LQKQNDWIITKERWLKARGDQRLEGRKNVERKLPEKKA